MKATPAVLLTVGLALAGVVLFRLANLPLPWLLGPIFAGLAGSLLRLPLKAPPHAPVAMRAILGVAIGASITPDVIGRLPSMAASVAMIPAMLFVIGLIGVPYFTKLCGFDRPTAFYSSMPGGFQDMVLFGEEAGGNIRALSLVHATRLLAIVSVMPFLLTHIWGQSLTGAPGEALTAVGVDQILIMLICAALGWWAAAKVNLFGAPILGPMIFAMVASLTGVLHARPPAEAILMAQFFIGIGIGVKYLGVTLQEIRTVVLAALGFCLILTVISAGFAEIVVMAGLAAPVEAFLAFAPGGQGEMVVLAIIAGADMAYVVTHHLVRVVLVLTVAPLIAGRRRR
ncbi:AbrB family transcriptional regulator [Paracoccaceae bacterium GXU_MW_L88]